jgi:thiol-disulfide isomerase/thioredoxin
MRKFLACLALASAAFAVVAQDPKPAEAKKPADDKKPEAKKPAVRKKAEVTLHVGDEPPALKADHWLQGEEVKSFEKGKVYVVEFWATWCGPCIVMMPHMAELQTQLREKGVVFIGYSKKDDTNTQEKVEAFVKRRGPKLGYTFCFAESPKVYESYMAASGHGGIPCCFVIDRDTKIAYIGHPMYLDFVLPKVVEGRWTPDDNAEVAKIEKDVNAVFQALSEKPDVVLKTLADFDKRYPALAGVPYFNAERLTSMLELKKYEDAKIFARNLMNKARRNSDDTLYTTVARTLRGKDGRTQPALREMAIKSAEEALALLGEDARGLMGVALTSYALGDATRGKSFAAKSLAKAELTNKTSLALQAAEAAIVEAKDKATGLQYIETAIQAAAAANQHYIETMSRSRAPSEAALLAEAAEYFVVAKDTASGAEYAAKALAAATESGKVGIQLSLASVYLSAGDRKTGDQYAKDALATAKENALPSVHLNLALAYYRADEKVVARTHAVTAMQTAPAAARAAFLQNLRRVLNDPEGKTDNE